jgi:hypothetical protein
MKYYFYLLAFVFTCCKKTDNFVKKGELPQDCFNPTGSIHKFRHFNCDSLYNGIISALKTDGVTLQEEDKKTIQQWVERKVMGAVFADENIIEWNLYDEDFCQNRITRIKDTEGQLIDSVSIPICNTRLSKDVSCGAVWGLKMKGAVNQLTIEYCNTIINTQKRVGYYEVINKNDKLERSPANYQFKREVITAIYFSYLNASNVMSSKKIHTGNAVLYDASVPDAKEKR